MSTITYEYQLGFRRPTRHQPGRTVAVQDITEAEVLALQSEGLLGDFEGAEDLGDDVECADGVNDQDRPIRVWRFSQD